MVQFIRFCLPAALYYKAQIHFCAFFYFSVFFEALIFDLSDFLISVNSFILALTDKKTAFIIVDERTTIE